MQLLPEYARSLSCVDAVFTQKSTALMGGAKSLRRLRRVGTLYPFAGLIILSLITPVPGAAAALLDRPLVQEYLLEAERETGISAERLKSLFSQIAIQQKVLDRISSPAEKTLTWKEYRPIFIKPERIQAGRQFREKYADLLARAEVEYGVPPHVVTAIIGVETFYGRLKGRDQALASLATLAFDYPPRAKFFRKELTEFLLLSVEEGFDPLAIKGSYAAAMGMPQFISSSYRRYAIDFDNDGRRDLWDSPADVIGSVANYLAVHGWEPGDPIAERVNPHGTQYTKLLRKKLKPAFKARQLADHGIHIRQSSGRKKSVMRFSGRNGTEVWVGYQNFYAITRYNHSSLYAMAVYELSQSIK